jgi:sugar lactone lactonase YvrE
MTQVIAASRLECLVRSRDQLGETPLWCERTRKLWWLDIEKPKLQRMREAAKKAFAWSTEEYLKQEKELVGFFQEQGLDVYEPDLGAFRYPCSKAVHGLAPIGFLASGHARKDQRAVIMQAVAFKGCGRS